eukprot:CAMPEP_0197288012 /NCGR_PEP_ID=MMETSP0890-20130614/4918_1 /TAXON_ID=44058 ORGANISM="Aureoumbra lagunensis, Strain CCMP1510" /NCGR_SAMPLE_ID=MMETSP0890 /ASSEMBLY_ACC=CAM_ASM_000533 /LENGTH=52 /DNA_ID=CAMNT_0042758365 /DNA_START=29 /DNA_END=187 /DNA_ORIENTATION=-
MSTTKREREEDDLLEEVHATKKKTAAGDRIMKERLREETLKLVAKRGHKKSC